MSREEIMRVIRQLACSQGFYSRLLQGIEEASEDEREEFFCALEDKNIGDAIDLVMYFET